MTLFIITGTCGAGKSTIKDQLAAMLDPERYACVDSDETGLNWWDYAGTDREAQYGADTLKERGFTSDEAIRPHIAYNQWIGRNRGKYQLFINNEGQSEEETAKIIMEYIKALPV